ncbi:MAG: hypothetical protein IPJ58_00380 [Ardenticatenia bacterium]|nr:hypothetical protein [Ardenticatenia bacterium]
MTADHESPARIAERPSLCGSCDFVRRVHGRRGQTYLLCGNERIAAKYPPQPVLNCPGYARKPAAS